MQRLTQTDDGATAFPVSVHLPEGPGKKKPRELRWSKKQNLKQAKFILSAVHDMSTRVQALGYPCYLLGPKDVSWFILGASTVPQTDIWFAVDLTDGATLDDLLQQLEVLKRHGNTFEYTDDSKRSCKIVIHEASPPESLGLKATMAYGLTKDGIRVYNPGYTLLSHFTQPRLQNEILAEYGLPERTYEQIVPVLKDLSKSWVDLREVFLDGERRDRLDELVKAVCAAHPHVKGMFTSLGFSLGVSALAGPVVTQAPVLVSQDVRIPEDNPRDDIVFEAAKMTVKVLCEAGYSCAVSGMVASYLLANDAELPLPDRTEITVFSDDDIKTIQRLVSKNHLYYTARMKVPGSDRRSPVLFYRIHGRGRGARKWKLCRIHFVMTQEPISYETTKGLPLLPQWALFADMLRLWHDNFLDEDLEAEKPGAYVQALLKAANDGDGPSSSGPNFFDDELQISRMKLFCSTFKESQQDAWCRLGYKTA